MNNHDEKIEAENRALRVLVADLTAEIGIAHDAIKRCAELLREYCNTAPAAESGTKVLLTEETSAEARQPAPDTAERDATR